MKLYISQNDRGWIYITDDDSDVQSRDVQVVELPDKASHETNIVLSINVGSHQAILSVGRAKTIPKASDA
jgi:hypothetical protein